MNEPTNEQLAEWIEKGLATEGVTEDRNHYLNRDSSQLCRACALGLAAIGKLGLEEADGQWQRVPGCVGGLAKMLGIAEIRAQAIEDHHIELYGNGQRRTAREIAAMLRNGEIE